MTKRARSAGVPALAVALFLLSAGSIRGEAAPERIQQHVEQVREGVELVLGGEAIFSRMVLPAFYEARGFAPAWSNAATRQDLLRAIDAAALDGLNPAGYHRAALAESLGPAVNASAPEVIADLDLLFTDALIRLGHDLILGRTDPAAFGAHWDFGEDLGDLDPVAALESAIGSGRVFDAVESYKPSHPLYVSLRTALAGMRDVAAKGGWGIVPDAKGLKLGVTSDAVPALRQRLAATGELAAGVDLASSAYDADVETAVQRFQDRNGLNPDGVLGTRTLAALNVSAEQRADQIRVNLERARWVLRNLGDDYVAVNIAGFRMYVVRDQKAVWTTRVVVGKNQHATPIFRSMLQYVVFNPTWTVPASITRNELLPKMRRDPAYLRKNDMTLLDRSGSPVDVAGVDLSPGKSFPYVVRQEPGPLNALGLVKFIFPNDHAVYFHDTPSRELFARDARAFSHGCIRVENPLDFAELLLSDVPGKDRAAIDGTVATGKTTTVHLAEPLPVLLLYWTAWVNPEGELKFYEDIYGRDGKVLAALDQAGAGQPAAP